MEMSLGLLNIDLCFFPGILNPMIPSDDLYHPEENLFGNGVGIDSPANEISLCFAAMIQSEDQGKGDLTILKVDSDMVGGSAGGVTERGKKRAVSG